MEKMGKDIFNSTYYPRNEDTDASRKPWVVIDAAGLRLGRLSTLIATYLRGANVASYSPSMNMGTYVVVINAEKVVVSGKKFEEKLYRRHETGRPGSMKTETFRKPRAASPSASSRRLSGYAPQEPHGSRGFHPAQGVRRVGAPARRAEPRGRHRGGQGRCYSFYHAQVNVRIALRALVVVGVLAIYGCKHTDSFEKISPKPLDPRWRDDDDGETRLGGINLRAGLS